MSAEDAQEQFQSCSLDGSQDLETKEDLERKLPNHSPGDEGSISPIANDQSADDQTAANHAELDRTSSVERSLERTVNLSTEGMGFVSLSPVEERDLFVTVADPMVYSKGSYVTYAITTKANRQTFASGEYLVRRRYQDFMWLHDQLERTYSTFIVPPLPEKHSIRGLVYSDHFTPEFLETRRAALQKFLTRVVDHPTISFDRHLHTFLTAKDAEFQAAKAEAVSFLDKVSTTVRGVASSVLLKNQDPEFASLWGYFGALEKHLSEFETTGISIMQDRVEAAQRHDALSNVCRQWATYEDELQQPLGSLADCFETNAGAARLLDKKLAPAFAPFHEYSLFCQAAKGVLKRRDALQMDFELAEEDLAARQATLNQVAHAEPSKSFMSLFSNPEQLKKERLAKAEENLTMAQRLADRMDDDLQCANEHLRADLQRWQAVKKHDFSEMFVHMADLHIDYFKECLSAWRTAVHALEEIPGEDTRS